MRLLSASGGRIAISCQAGSRWRSYQATYSSTIAAVAGCVVTSSTRPSPITKTRRPSRRASRYSAPVLMRPLFVFAGRPERRELGGDNLVVRHLLVEEAKPAGKTVDRGDRVRLDHRVVIRQVALDDAGDQPGLARREAVLAGLGRAG